MDMLFGPTFITDDQELTNFLASPDHRDFLEGLWLTFYPYIKAKETEFRDFKAQPHARIWEMYLAVALSERGFDLADRLGEGPDVQLRNPTVWVEAVVSTDGAKGNNKAIQPGSQVPEILLSESMWGGPPENATILRCLSSIDAKLKKLKGYRDSKGNYRPGYVEKGIVKETEPYVVALNTYKTSFAQLDHQHTPNHIPTIVRALFGYGESVLLQLHPIDGFSKPISFDRFDYVYRPYLLGTGVASDIFFQQAYSGVSALIVSRQVTGHGDTESPHCLAKTSSLFTILWPKTHFQRGGSKVDTRFGLNKDSYTNESGRMAVNT